MPGTVVIVVTGVAPVVGAVRVIAAEVIGLDVTVKELVFAVCPLHNTATIEPLCVEDESEVPFKGVGVIPFAPKEANGTSKVVPSLYVSVT